jgi:hypothetical protein
MGIDLFQNKIASLLLLLSLVAVVALSGCLESSDKNTQKYTLMVKNMDIVPGQTKTSTIELKVTTYIENKGSASAPLTSKNTSLQLKATSTDKDFLVNQTTTFMGKIAPDKTVNVTQTLLLPKKGGYKLEALLFEEGKEVDRGSRTVYNLESLPADSMVTGLRIDGIDFLVRKAAEGRVVIQSDIYVTNFGGRTSQDYQLMIKATDIDSKLVADKQWSNTGLIAPDATAIRSVNLTVPDRYNYVVDVLIWSNSTIVGQGRDYVQLNATTMLSDKERLASKGTQTGIFVTETAPQNATAMMNVGEFESTAKSAASERTTTPGFDMLMAIAMICLVAVGLTVRKGR